MSGSTYYPGNALISGITNEQFAVISFLNPHNFTPGEFISLRLGKQNAMKALNQARTQVLTITTNSVTTNLDTTNQAVYADSGTVQAPNMAVPAGSGIIPQPVYPFIAVVPPTVNLQDASDNVPTL